MFTRRKYNKTTVIDDTVVPVHNVIDSLIEDRDLNLTYKKFPITEEELFACVDFVLDREESNPRDDFLNFSIETTDAGEILVNTESLSNWVFLTCITYGHALYPHVKDVTDIYTRGLENIMFEVFTDLSNDTLDFKTSRIHNIAYDSFIASYGSLTEHDINLLLTTLEAELQKYDYT